MDTQAPRGLATDSITITTVSFGVPESVCVPAAALYAFPDALPGLPDSHRFALIASEAYEPFCWLQSLDEVHLCLPVLGLSSVRAGDYVRRAAKAAGEQEEGLAERMLLVTRYDEEAATFLVNLMAPIIIDNSTGTGRQAILEGPDYPLRLVVRWNGDTCQFEPPC
jgi:flagellar assembly factor FliW